MSAATDFYAGFGYYVTEEGELIESVNDLIKQERKRAYTTKLETFLEKNFPALRLQYAGDTWSGETETLVVAKSTVRAADSLKDIQKHLTAVLDITDEETDQLNRFGVLVNAKETPQALVWTLVV